MNFLTDENIAPATVRAIRELGFGVKDIKEENRHGSSDLSVIELAIQKNLVIITMDTDFAKLFNRGVIKTGVITIRHNKQKTPQITERLIKFLGDKTEEDIFGKSSLVD